MTNFGEWILFPFLRIPFIRKASPKLLTGLGLLLGLSVALFLPLGLTWIALACLVTSGLFDMLDGAVARKRGIDSPEGAVLDITSDRLVEMFVLLGLFLVAPAERGLFSFLMLGSILFCVTTFLVVGIFSENTSEKSFHYSPGLIERPEAFAFFAFLILFPSWFVIGSALFTGLVTLTGVLRLYQFFLNTSKPKTRKIKSRIE